MPATDSAWRSRSEGAGGNVVRQTRWTFGISRPGRSGRRMPFIRPFAGGVVGSDDLYLVWTHVEGLVNAGPPPRSEKAEVFVPFFRPSCTRGGARRRARGAPRCRAAGAPTLGWVQGPVRTMPVRRMVPKAALTQFLGFLVTRTCAFLRPIDPEVRLKMSGPN